MDALRRGHHRETTCGNRREIQLLDIVAFHLDTADGHCLENGVAAIAISTGHAIQFRLLGGAKWELAVARLVVDDVLVWGGGVDCGEVPGGMVSFSAPPTHQGEGLRRVDPPQSGYVAGQGGGAADEEMIGGMAR